RLVRTMAAAGQATGIGLTPSTSVRLDHGLAAIGGQLQAIILDSHEARVLARPTPDSSSWTSVLGLTVSVVPPDGAYDLERHLPRF
ncbi:MAG: hypothetical protein KGR26_07140, partial [Cyanobacteria bacterium REEB65]|nr:hypothetical protein [Cyanobacteria bacterium REEB65]